MKELLFGIVDHFFPQMGFSLRSAKIPRIVQKEYNSIFVILDRAEKLFEFKESLLVSLRNNTEALQALENSLVSKEKGNFFSFGYNFGAFCSKIMEGTLQPDFAKQSTATPEAIEEKVKALLNFQKVSKNSMRSMN